MGTIWALDPSSRPTDMNTRSGLATIVASGLRRTQRAVVVELRQARVREHALRVWTK